MPIEFRCTQCNALLRTADHTAGLQAKCPQCGAVLDVPNVTAPPDPPIQHAERETIASHPPVNPFDAPAAALPSFDAGYQGSGMATGSLVCGALALFTSPCFCFPPLPVTLAVVALVLGVLALGQIRLGRAGGQGMAIAGLALGGIGLGIHGLIWLAMGMFTVVGN